MKTNSIWPKFSNTEIKEIISVIKSGKVNFLKAGVFRINNNKYRYGNNLYFDLSLLNNCTIRHYFTGGKDHYFTNEDVEKIMSVLS